MDREEIVHALAAMTEAEYETTVSQARGPDNPAALKEKAAAMLRGYATGESTAYSEFDALVEKLRGNTGRGVADTTRTKNPELHKNQAAQAVADYLKGRNR